MSSVMPIALNALPGTSKSGVLYVMRMVTNGRAASFRASPPVLVPSYQYYFTSSLAFQNRIPSYPGPKICFLCTFQSGVPPTCIGSQKFSAKLSVDILGNWKLQFVIRLHRNDTGMPYKPSKYNNRPLPAISPEDNQARLWWTLRLSPCSSNEVSSLVTLSLKCLTCLLKFPFWKYD
jgi:hypothetical protein